MSAAAEDASTVAPADAAHRAFERGDFREARRLARAQLASSEGASDAAGRAAAETLLRRTGLDPLIVWLAAGCLVLFALIALFVR